MSSQDDLNALKAQINEMQQQLNSQQTTIGHLSGALQSAYSVSSDVVKTLTNAKVVGTNGNLGTLSHADSLAGAPIGDAGRLRGDMGLGELATKGALSDAPVGDADKLRRSMWLGEMAKLSYLDQCEVGQAEKLRTKIGLGELATKGRLSDADVGDQGRLRENMGLGEAARYGVRPEVNGQALDGNGILVTGDQLKAARTALWEQSWEAFTVKTGWNSNGFWARYPGRLVTCFQHFDGYNAGPGGQRWTYPIAFESASSVVITATVEYKGTWQQRAVMVAGRSKEGVSIFLSDVGGDLSGYHINIQATGLAG